MGTPDEKRLTFRLEALEWIEAWGLIFSEKFSYTEVWGEHPYGLTQSEVVEIGIAYDEWDRLQAAIRAWEKTHDPRQEERFDITSYLAERRAEILGYE